MCGIYAVSGKNAGQRVLSGLKRLEYRGYDSWGVAVLNQGRLQLEKSTEDLAGSDEGIFPETQLALGHTRWATHGGVTQKNAHPHAANDGSFVLVQNGVVENYQQLKAELEQNGYEFQTETDTEVIVALLEKEMVRRGETKVGKEAVLAVFSRLDGRNTVAVLTREGSLIAVRDGSPLIVARNAQGEYFFSSDTLSLVPDAEEYLIVGSREVVEIDENHVEITSVDSGRSRKMEFRQLEEKNAVNGHAGYENFMLMEISHQAGALSQVVRNARKLGERFSLQLKRADKVFITGAGTAYFAALQIAYFLREVGIDARAVAAYEAENYLGLMNKKSLLIAISQSGETADTNEVVEKAKANGVTIASAVNMEGSTLTSLSDYPFMIGVGAEVAVASTKAFMGHVVWGKVMAGLIDGEAWDQLVLEVAEFEGAIELWMEDKQIQKELGKLVKLLSKHPRAFILGRGQMYASALEAALKLKEISYLHAEGFSGGELKHGVIALIEKGTPVFVLIAEDSEKPAMTNAAAEVSARGGLVIGVAEENNPLFSEWIPLPHFTTSFSALAAVLPFQILTCRMAMAQGRNPDKPRNLAKSVTVK